jgi:hypothetical protein
VGAGWRRPGPERLRNHPEPGLSRDMGSHYACLRTKQVRRSLLTRRLLIFSLGLEGGQDEPVEPEALATPSSPSAAQGGIGCPHIPEGLGRAGTRPGAVRHRHRRRARRDPADHPQLVGRLRPRAGPVGPLRRGPERPPSRLGRADRGPPAAPDGPVTPGPRLSSHGLDGAPAPARIGEGPGAETLGRDGTARAPSARLRLEAAALRPRPRPGARGKNGGFGGRSRPCRSGASCWPRTRPT